MVYHQALSLYQFLGIGFGLVSTVIATLGDIIWKKVFSKPNQIDDNSPDHKEEAEITLIKKEQSN